MTSGRAALDALLYGMGAATMLAGFSALVWRIARPHVVAWFDRQLAPIRQDLEAVRGEVKPDGGESLKDAAATAAATASSADAKLDQLRHSVHRVGRQVQRVEGQALVTRGILDQHVRESSRYQRSLGHVFRELGVDPPQWGTETEIEDEETTHD